MVQTNELPQKRWSSNVGRIITSFVLVCTLLGGTDLSGQELPPILTFFPSDYGADNQNWMISQAPDKLIYIANNQGLLQFNGSGWQLFPSPNNSIIRTVSVEGDRIYTGCYMDFGYWQKNDLGLLDYISLKEELKLEMIDDENFWGIQTLGEWILFQSARRICFYNTGDDSYKVINADDDIQKMNVIDGRLFYFVANQGIYTIKEGNPHLLIPSVMLADDRVMDIFPQEDGIMILLQKNGFYTYTDGKCRKWEIPANKILSQTSIFCGLRLSDNSYALGTISDGLIFMSENGEIRYHIKKINGLNNNTVLSLFEDEGMNVWVGLDNGINCINLNSPIRIFNDYRGEIGTVYASLIHNGYLYLGTNQGLFFKKYGSQEPFKFIDNTAGQVWCLKVIDGDLLCGHHAGTFLVRGDTAEEISNIRGTWKIEKIGSRPDLLIQGNYSGIYILSKQQGKWKYRNKMEGFYYSARYFEVDDENTIWVSHEYKGIFKVVPDITFTRATEVSLDTDIPNGKNSGLIKFRDQIYYSYKHGIYRLNRENNKFVIDSLLSKILLNDEYVSGKLIVDDENNLWAFTKNSIFCISVGQLSEDPIIKTLPISNQMRKTMSGYDNIAHLTGNNYLLGTVDGYLLIDISRFRDQNFSVILNKVSLLSVNNEITNINPGLTGDFSHSENTFRFDYSVPEYDKYSATEYQYRLLGVNSNWSKWSSDHTQIFENLKHGDYQFHVRARVGSVMTDNIGTYSFKIEKPWQITNTAIAGYILIGLISIVFLNILYNRNYRIKKDRELELSKKQYELSNLEAQQQIILMKNEQLRRDIESKSSELFVSTMSIAKKNELLGTIKKGLDKVSGSSEIKPIVHLIDKNLDNKNDWKVFEEAFNNTDKDFFRKVKKYHPELTHNDLRLCAYLRLNLSTKEIAPLLNISVKSVEIKRYRLRKKMDLPHNKSLVDYILEV